MADTTDPEKLKLVLEQILRISQQAQLAFGGMNAQIKELGLAAAQGSDGLDSVSKQLETFGVRFGQIDEKGHLFLEDTHEALDGIADQIQLSGDLAEKALDKWRRGLEQVGEMFDSISKRPGFIAFNTLATGLGSGAFSLGTNTGGMLNSALGSMPLGIGSLLQLGMEGMQHQSRLDAGGAQALMPFAQNTGNTAAMQAAVGRGGTGSEMIRRLQANFQGGAGDVAAISQQLASVGFDIKKGLQPLADGQEQFKNFGNTAVEQLLALDRAIQVPAGTTAAITAQLTTSTNRAFSENLDLVRGMSAASKEAGMGFQAFSSGIAQSVSSLRMLGADADTSLVIFTNLSKAMQGMGISKEVAGGYAMGGMNDLQKGNQNMGMRAELGKRMAKDLLGHDVDEITALRMYDTGFAGETNVSTGKLATGADISRARITALTTQAQDYMGKDPKALYMFLQSLDNLTPIMAHLISSGRGGDLLNPELLEAAKKKDREERKKTEDERPLQQLLTGDYEQLLQRVQLPLQALGNALLQAVLGLAGTMASGLIMLGQVISDTGNAGQYMDQFGAGVQKTIGNSSKAVDQALNQLRSVEGGQSSAFEALNLQSPLDQWNFKPGKSQSVSDKLKSLSLKQLTILSMLNSDAADELSERNSAQARESLHRYDTQPWEAQTQTLVTPQGTWHFSAELVSNSSIPDSTTPGGQ